MDLKAKLFERVSNKGNNYLVIEVEFPNGYKKMVFPDFAEKYMLEDLLKHSLPKFEDKGK